MLFLRWEFFFASVYNTLNKFVLLFFWFFLIYNFNTEVPVVFRHLAYKMSQIKWPLKKKINFSLSQKQWFRSFFSFLIQCQTFPKTFSHSKLHFLYVQFPFFYNCIKGFQHNDLNVKNIWNIWSVFISNLIVLKMPLTHFHEYS